MQAIFDPSQGFLNAMLFVFLSSRNMTAIYEALAQSPLYISFRKNAIVQVICGKYSVPELSRSDQRIESSSTRLNDSSVLCLVSGKGSINKMPLLNDDEQSDYDSSYYSEDRSLAYRGADDRGWSGDESGMYNQF